MDILAMITLDTVNAMTSEAFIAAFGDVAEHSPWVARHAASARPYATREAMIAAFAAATRAAPRVSQLALVRAHPDLATRAKLTEDSTREQAGAGFDTLTPEEFARFTHLNDRYKAKFGFPFIFAVKGATKHQILASFEERLDNTPEIEFAMAITQICRIFRFRIEDRVAP
jgi:2-oxo-4-hydroxy-4-carboxy-5-ureidoimidazoline decarboxylase